MRLGAASLCDDELWCCVLGTGTKQRPLVATARWLASAVTSLSALEKLSQTLTEHCGDAQRARVLAVLELAKRLSAHHAQQIRTLDDVLIRAAQLRRFKKEHVLALYCSASAEVIHEEVVAIGGLNSAYIEPRDVLSPIQFQPVDSIVVCHNHPSGSPEPSPADMTFTARLAAACRIMGIGLRDHVIVSPRGHYSFREHGHLRDEA